MLAALLGALSLSTTAPAQAQTTVWSATLTVVENVAGTLDGCLSSYASGTCAAGLTDDDFEYAGETFVVTGVISISGDLRLRLDKTFPNSLRTSAELRVDGQTFALSNASFTSQAGVATDNLAFWTTGPTWTANQQVSLSLLEPPPFPTVSLSASPTSVREGENVTVTATLSEPLSRLVEIPLDPTKWDTDDVRGPGAIAVLPGSTTGSELFLAVRDCDTEDETFTVALNTDSLPSLSLREGTQSSVTVTITDDGTEWCDSRPPSNTGGTGGGGGGGGSSPGGGEPPSEDEEPSTSCPQEDRETLVSFYEMTDGETWDRNEYWNSDEPLGEWHGVDTDDAGEVVSLRLSNNNLSGDMRQKNFGVLRNLWKLPSGGTTIFRGKCRRILYWLLRERS